MTVHIGRYVAGAGVAGYAALQLLGRRAGASCWERRAALLSDDLVPHPNLVTNHAITIGVPPERLWPWLTQMGWHLGGYYTPGWVDRLLFPRNWPSLEHLDPALVRDLAAGDVIPDGVPGTAWFVVAEADRPRTLVLHSTTHVPANWRDRLGVAIDWTWTFRLTPLPKRGTRLHLRVRGRTKPGWVTTAYQAAIVPADFIMAMGMLRGIKRRAESAPPPRSSGRVPLPVPARSGG
jgi:hypothetical protein